MVVEQTAFVVLIRSFVPSYMLITVLPETTWSAAAASSARNAIVGGCYYSWWCCRRAAPRVISFAPGFVRSFLCCHGATASVRSLSQVRCEAKT